MTGALRCRSERIKFTPLALAALSRSVALGPANQRSSSLRHRTSFGTPMLASKSFSRLEANPLFPMLHPFRHPSSGLTPQAGHHWRKKAQVISGALILSARTTSQPSQNLVEPSWNPGGTLVEPWWNPRSWNLTSGPPRTTPEPIWAETPSVPNPCSLSSEIQVLVCAIGLILMNAVDCGRCFPCWSQWNIHS